MGSTLGCSLVVPDKPFGGDKGHVVWHRNVRSDFSQQGPLLSFFRCAENSGCG